MPDEPRLLKESSSLCRTNPYSSFSCGLTYATFILTLFENDALVPTFDVQRNWWWIEVILNFRIPYQRFYIFSRTQTDFLMCLKCVQTGRFKGSYKTSVWQIQPFNEIKTLHSSAFDNYTNIVKTATYISVVTILLDVRTRKQYDSWLKYDNVACTFYTQNLLYGSTRAFSNTETRKFLTTKAYFLHTNLLL